MSAAPRTVMVTGAAGHLGRAVAAAFAAGAWLVLVDREPRVARRRAFGAGATATGCVGADLLDAARTQAAVDSAVQRFGRIDALCHWRAASAWARRCTRPATTHLGLPVRHQHAQPRHVARAVVPRHARQGGGGIVTVAAASAARGLAQMGAYCRGQERADPSDRSRCRPNCASGTLTSTACCRRSSTRRTTAPRCPMPTGALGGAGGAGGCDRVPVHGRGARGARRGAAGGGGGAELRAGRRVRFIARGA